MGGCGREHELTQFAPTVRVGSMNVHFVFTSG